jgi:quercetin dioxygenase-like cupin family protein
MAKDSGAYIVQPGQAELRWMGETSTYFLAAGDETGGAFCLVDERAVRGESVPLHRHSDDMESFYVLEGELTLYLDDQPGLRAPAGTFAHVPGGAVHGFRVESETARYLLLTTPRHGEFYRAISLASRPGGEPPEESVEGSQIERACRDYGIEFIGTLPDQANQ